MGPFSDSGIELLGILLFGVVAFAIWIFNQGRGAAASETPNDSLRRIQTLDDLPRSTRTETCSDCGATEFTAFMRDAHWHCRTCAEKLLTPEDSPRHNKTSTSGRADG
jgi:hypothetical protein